MKIKRYKKVNRHLNFYVNNFGFHHPYQVLVDGTFCFAALQVRNLTSVYSFSLRFYLYITESSEYC